MKKLLLILLCVPLIGFGQTKFEYYFDDVDILEDGGYIQIKNTGIKVELFQYSNSGEVVIYDTLDNGMKILEYHYTPPPHRSECGRGNWHKKEWHSNGELKYESILTAGCGPFSDNLIERKYSKEGELISEFIDGVEQTLFLKLRPLLAFLILVFSCISSYRIIKNFHPNLKWDGCLASLLLFSSISLLFLLWFFYLFNDFIFNYHNTFPYDFGLFIVGPLVIIVWIYLGIRKNYFIK